MSGLAAIAMAQAVGFTLTPPVLTVPELSEQLKTCIITNAPAVERAVSSLNEAADFLVYKVCAGALADEQAVLAKVRADKMKTRMQAMCAAQAQNQPKGAPADPDDDEANYDACSGGASMFDADDFSGFGVAPQSPKGMALAAATLLKLRNQHR